MLRIRLPFPDRNLNPNRSHGVHWAKLREAKRDAWEIGFFEARKAGYRMSPPYFRKDKPIQARICIYPPDNRRRDWDNIVAALKSYQDGIFAQIGEDDSRIRRPDPVMRRSCPEGKVYYILYQ